MSLTTKPVILDLFCGAGGAAKGYADAGFTVVGIDMEPQPNYPYEFIQGDALDALALIDFTPDVVHASPPCQAYSPASGRARKRGTIHKDLVAPTRELLVSGFPECPYVMENVPGAPLIAPVQLCGSSFGLDVRRHRLFEANWLLRPLPCDHSWQTPRFRSLSAAAHKAGKLASVVGVHGNLNYAGEREIREKAMDIDWMTPYELTQSIPPAYTEYIGRQLLERGVV